MIKILQFSVMAFALASCTQQYAPPSEPIITQDPSVHAVDESNTNCEIEIPENWTNYSIAGDAFSIAVPNTLELSDKDSPYAKRMEKMGCEVNADVVIFQQKGLNNSKRGTEDQHYCRVMLQHVKCAPGSVPKANEDYTLTEDDKTNYKRLAIEQLAHGQHLINGPHVKFTEFNGLKATAVDYTRSGNDGKTTKATMYFLFNYDEYVQIITAYRESEFQLWAVDMSNVITTFRWK